MSFNKSRKIVQRASSSSTPPILETIQNYVQQGDSADAVLRKVRNAFSSLDPQHHTTILNSFAQKGDADSAIRWISKISKPSAGNFAKVVLACAKSGESGKARFWFDKGRSHNVLPDANAFGSIVDGFAKRGQMSEAEKWLTLMEEYRVPAKVSTYNALISGYARSSSDENRNGAVNAVRVFELMISKQICADERSFNSVIDSFSKCDDLVNAKLWLDRMERSLLSPTLITYTSLINASARVGDSVSAEMYLQKMLDKKIAVDAMAVSTVIDSHARNGDVESASNVLTKMLNMNVKPSIAMFNAMIHSCAMYEDENRFCTGDRFEAIHWLNRARELNLTPDAYTYTNLLHLAAQNHDADAACDYFVQMVQNKFTPSIECANAVVDVYTKILQPRRGISFFNKFQEFDVLADKISFKIVFAACRDACMQQNPVHNM